MKKIIFVFVCVLLVAVCFIGCDKQPQSCSIISIKTLTDKDGEYQSFLVRIFYKDLYFEKATSGALSITYSYNDDTKNRIVVPYGIAYIKSSPFTNTEYANMGYCVFEPNSYIYFWCDNRYNKNDVPPSNYQYASSIVIRISSNNEILDIYNLPLS